MTVQLLSLVYSIKSFSSRGAVECSGVRQCFHFFPDTNTCEISYPVSYLTKKNNIVKKVAVAGYTQFTTL